MNRTLPSDRLVSLDVFRGLVVAAMVLVDNPGTYTYVYSQLNHAEWMGATATDMIFPAFLFMVGLAIPFAFATRIARGASRKMLALHVLRRSVLLFLIGLALNGLPDYHLATLRIPGILQRIAICYLLGALLYLWARGRGARLPQTRVSFDTALVAGVAVGSLALYWVLLKLFPVPGIGAGHLDSYGNLAAYIDRAVFGLNHLWAWGLTPGKGVTYDPEGILSTVSAFTSTLLGILVGGWLRPETTPNPTTPDQSTPVQTAPAISPKTKALWLALSGVALFLIGWLLSPLLPLNKRIYTSTFALFAGGVSLMVFAALYYVVDVRGWRRWTSPTLVFGTNALLAFTISQIVSTLLDRIHIHVHHLSLHTWAYQRLFAPWLPPYLSSLAYAIAIVLLNLLLIYPFYRKRIFLKL